jgi:hypothetical protein
VKEPASHKEDPNTKSVIQTITTVRRTTTVVARKNPDEIQSIPGLMLNVVRFMHGSDPSNVKDLYTNVWDLYTNIWD